MPAATRTSSKRSGIARAKTPEPEAMIVQVHNDSVVQRPNHHADNIVALVTNSDSRGFAFSTDLLIQVIPYQTQFNHSAGALRSRKVEGGVGEIVRGRRLNQ